MDDRRSRSSNPWARAEAAFKSATAKPAEPVAKAPAIPGGREQVTLRLDRAVLEHFQAAGPGWQDRINAALKQVVASQ